VIYTDEDLIGDDGTRLSVFFKPDFNRDLLFSHNYVTHFIVVTAELFKMIGGFCSDYDGAQDYDLMLKLSEQTENITHIPEILYHWRASDSSTSINHGQKSYAHQAGKRALEKSLKRRNLTATVEDTDLKFYYRVKYTLPEEPTILVIQWLEDSSEENDSRLSRLKNKTQYGKSRFLCISGARHKVTHRPISSLNLQKEATESAASADGVHTKARLLHAAILSAETDYIALIDSNIIDVEMTWLEELLAPLQQNDQIGIVCGNILNNSATGESYTIPDLTNRNSEYLINFLAMSSIHANGFHCTQLIHYCNWTFCLLSRSLFTQLGGFDFDSFPHLFAMADFSMRAVEQGKNILYTPFARATLDGYRNTVPIADRKKLEEEKRRFQNKWKQRLETFDSYYNHGILGEHKIDRGHFRQWMVGEYR